MKPILRFLIGILPASILLLIAPLFPVDKSGGAITRGKVRLLALWLIGLEGFQ